MSFPEKSEPLLPPHDWPGCALGYAIVPDGEGRPALRVGIEYDPAAMAAGAEAGLTAWLCIRRQANDPSLVVTLSCTLAGKGGVGTPADTILQYRAAMEHIFRHVAGGGTAPSTAVITLALDPAQIATQDMLLPLTAVLTIARHRTAAPGDQETSWEQVRTLLAPWTPASSEDASPLTAWSRTAEAALAGYDGAGGRIRLALPSSIGGDRPDPWVVRWGGSNGISLARGEGAEVAFAAQPFAVELLSGSIAVTTWNEALVPVTASRAYRGIDADAVFDRVLAIIDQLMLPTSIAAFGRADPDAARWIEESRHAMAQALAERLAPVRAAPEPLGSLSEASRAMHRAIVSGFSVPSAAIAQVPLAGPSPSSRLRLRGVLSSGLSGEDAQPCRAEVMLDQRTPAWLTFPIAFPQDDERAALSLEVAWRTTHIEHLDDAGAVSSPGSLRLLHAEEAPDLVLNKMNIPLVARFHPEPVTLQAREASRSGGEMAGQTLADFLKVVTRWSFSLSVGHAGLLPEDDLWLVLAFNRPLDWHPTIAAETKPLTPMVGALLRFEEGHASIASRLEESAPMGDSLASIMGGLARDLARSITAPAAAPAVATCVGDGETITWVWRDGLNPDGSHSLFALVEPADAGGVCFPTVAGAAPQDRGLVTEERAPGSGSWREATYCLPADRDRSALTFVLAGLDLAARQTVAASASVVRNPATAGFGAQFERTTGWMPLGTANIPAIDITEPFAVPPCDASLQQALIAMCDAVSHVGNRIAVDRRIDVRITYQYPMISDEGGSELPASVPVIFASLPVPEAGGAAPAAEALVADCRAWCAANPLPRAGARLSMAAVLLGAVSGTPVSLLNLRQVDLPLP